MVHLAESTLQEQMGMNERDIARRLHHLDFSDDDIKRMRAVLPHAEEALDKIIHDFYESQLSDSEIAAIIGDIDTLKRLQQTMRVYICSMFCAEYDEPYVNNRLRIGKVHKRLGVTPKLYMSSLSTLQRLLDSLIDNAFSIDAAEEHKLSMHKIMLFDAQLVFEAYIDGFLAEMETAKREVDKYAAGFGIHVDTLTRHLHEISTKDTLTGLFNRRAFSEYLEHECDAAKRHKLPLTLVYFDLNGFKSINDLHGHDEGDRVLRQTGKAILAMTRSVDIPARYGGDEFCIIMPRTKLDVVKFPIERLIREFDARREHSVTFSIGVVQTGPENVDLPRDLIKKADDLMYAAKGRAHKRGGHQIELSLSTKCGEETSDRSVA